METYAGLFENLSSSSKFELLERLLGAIRKSGKSGDKEFFKSFGAFASSSSAEEIVKEIRADRKFRRKDLKL